jgi:mRNA interferase HigB
MLLCSRNEDFRHDSRHTPNAYEPTMPMRIIGLPRLKQFTDLHTDCKSWIDHWIREVEKSDWKSPQDIKARFSSASFLAENVVIFNVKGNNYRLKVQVAFPTRMVVIKWIGTHAEYDKLA